MEQRRWKRFEFPLSASAFFGVIFLFIHTECIPLSDTFLIFNNLRKAQENSDACKTLLQIDRNDVAILNGTVFMKNETKQSCYVKCLYEKAGLINNQSYLEVSIMASIINDRITVNTSEEIKNNVALNLISACQYFYETKSACLRSVQIMYCLETAVYLYNYGYFDRGLLDELLGYSISQNHFSEAVMKFQQFFNLEVTGMPDENTYELIMLPRCGVTDIELKEREKRFVLSDGKKWEKSTLTYRIMRYPQNVSKNEVDNEIAKAFRTWIRETPLKITQKKTGEADIEVDFVEKDHGDDSAFDGPGGLLAHAFYPMYRDGQQGQKSYIHFDSTENWANESQGGLPLYEIALHEIGHALGLKHSKKKKAVMWPLYDSNRRKYNLARDDIQGIKELYAPKNDLNLFQRIKKWFFWK